MRVLILEGFLEDAQDVLGGCGRQHLVFGIQHSAPGMLWVFGELNQMGSGIAIFVISLHLAHVASSLWLDVP